MSDDEEPVIFSVVGSDGAADQPGHRGPDASTGSQEALPFDQGRDRDPGLPFKERQDYLGSDRFPLAGPIVDGATSRQLKGKCSSCESKLRIRVRDDGPVKVRCPVCGHARQLEL